MATMTAYEAFDMNALILDNRQPMAYTLGNPINVSSFAGNNLYFLHGDKIGAFGYEKADKMFLIEDCSVSQDYLVQYLKGEISSFVLRDKFLGGNDTIAGSSGNDVLLGGDGNDTINGGSGDDKLIGGAGDDIVSGSGGIDTLQGNDGNDLLNGHAGKDTLAGGGGADRFRFNSALSSSNVDAVTDFSISSGDTLQLDNIVFTKLVNTGALNAANFSANLSGNAADSNDYITFETDTGKLFYDADGNGGGAKIVFAVIGTTTHPALTAADLTVI